MGLKDKDVIETLTGDGVSLDRWLALGNHLVGYFDETGRLMTEIIENDALATAASKLLRKRGQIHHASDSDS
ncbi:hypothetical protein [Duganella sp. Root198D2]|uniref:hypothetical protein n=1 Tax=Duganella sp. Root198D2 TaxID=1736489 RepID=UPI0007097ECF|nr:hypothetical protein [Duganella sp. Root198D2]KRB98276.1 hypothetical protein ASE26_25540 [Duganella sp. Root198D2]